MRCITLWQPWASLVAIGAKTIETRSWGTSYRGPLAIHAGQAWDGTLVRLCKSEPFAEVLEAAGLCERGPRGGWRTSLPFGKVVAIAQLVDVVPTGDVFTAGVWAGRDTPQERAFGDYADGALGLGARRRGRAAGADPGARRHGDDTAEHTR